MKRVTWSWHMRDVMREHGVTVRELIDGLRDRGVVLSQSQVYREIAGSQKTFSMPFAVAFCDILGCSFNDIITFGVVEVLPRPASEPDMPRTGLPPRARGASEYPPLRPVD